MAEPAPLPIGTLSADLEVLRTAPDSPERRAAFDRIASEWFGKLVKWAGRQAKNVSSRNPEILDPEDLAADVLWNLWKSRDRLRPPFSTPQLIRWFTTALRYVAYAERRRLNLERRVDADLEAIACEVGQPEVFSAKVPALHAAINRLTPANRDAVSVSLQGLSTAECAETLGISVSAFKVRFHRAKAILHQDQELRRALRVRDDTPPGGKAAAM